MKQEEGAWERGTVGQSQVALHLFGGDGEVDGRLVWLGIPGEPPGQGVPPAGWAEASWV